MYRPRAILKRLLRAPISPRAYAALVCLLRSLGILRRLPAQDSVAIRRIFVSHPYSSVGDLVLLLPLLEQLTHRWPTAKIDIAVGGNVADLLSGTPGLNRIFHFASDRRGNSLLENYARVFRGISFYRNCMMRHDYDLTIAPRWGSIMTSDAVYLAYLTGARICCGYSGTVDGGNASIDLLLTHAATGGADEHESIRNVRLLHRVGLNAACMEGAGFASRPIESLVHLARQCSREQLERLLPASSPRLFERYAVVSPGATAPFRIWPTERLVELMQRLHQQSGIYFYVIGGKKDSALCEHLAQHMPAYAISIAGRTSLKELTALVYGAALFVGNDSGTAHIAGGLGVPTVVVSPFPQSCRDEHPNSPVRFRPCGPLVKVVQPATPLAPCAPTCNFPEAHCIRQVSIEQVLEAANQLTASQALLSKE